MGLKCLLKMVWSLLWHNGCNDLGDGHLERPIKRSAAADFPLEENHEEIE